ncbi:short chain dehydrogenase [Aureococcus anophagefferens]|nr:short chain dehydrogenase [Aureococcus anophagefferens]
MRRSARRALALNWRMRHASASRARRPGHGARVKIGFEIGCKLLRAGATLVATTRFPADALDRYARLDDFEAFRHRLVVHAVDLRDLRGVEAFCAFLDSTLDRLDVVVNNACQTVRRPAAYYRGLADAAARALAAPGASSAAVPWHAAADAAPASELSQLRVAPEDSESAGGALAGAVGVNGQQLDNRTRNSWTLKLRDVSAPEVVEAMAINAVAPFILNARLQRLLAVAAAAAGQAFVVNVSAMEGKFYRHKTPNHPHTNMAKAALNMMTRTSAADLARSNVYMTAVDTGWINDENPRDVAARTAAAGFQTPIDEVDAAARVCHPIFHGVETGAPLFGVFPKDYVECEW